MNKAPVKFYPHHMVIGVCCLTSSPLSVVLYGTDILSLSFSSLTNANCKLITALTILAVLNFLFIYFYFFLYNAIFNEKV